MPIAFDLEALRKKFGCSTWFETGLWNPTEEVSSKKALRSGFSSVYCIELRQDWIALGQKVFADEIHKGLYHLIHDDSCNMKKYLEGPDFKERCMFFLDAHVDNSNIHNYKLKCPLLEELKAIGSLERKDHIILLDDLRVIKETFPWGEQSYGNINFLRRIQEQVLSINKDYKFDTLDGYIKDDVLMCYL